VETQLCRLLLDLARALNARPDEVADESGDAADGEARPLQPQEHKRRRVMVIRFEISRISIPPVSNFFKRERLADDFAGSSYQPAHQCHFNFQRRA